MDHSEHFDYDIDVRFVDKWNTTIYPNPENSAGSVGDAVDYTLEELALAGIWAISVDKFGDEKSEFGTVGGRKADVVLLVRPSSVQHLMKAFDHWMNLCKVQISPRTKGSPF
jgi:hypothetical protein